jgi:tetratricopeptide (TPR) repeat protein
MPDDDPRTGKAWPFVMSWTGRISAVIGLGVSIGGGVTWLVAHHRQKIERQAQMALAQSEATLGQYPAALQTYAGILKSDPLDSPALDGQVTATMLWVENFHSLDSTATGPALDQIMAILAASLVRAKGPHAADIQAHLGWAHWLNQHLAAREFGPDAEQNLRAALAADPRNVYANAMLGNWTLQNGGNIADAVQLFNAAVATGKARPFVRTLQLAGLVDRDVAGARGAVMQAANDMRRSGEPLDPNTRRRVVTFCCDPSLNNHAELAESLAAIPPEDAGSTYLWLDGPPSDPDAARLQSLQLAFIQANLSEIAGNQQQALAQYRQLHLQLSAMPGTLLDAVDAAILRTSQSP